MLNLFSGQTRDPPGAGQNLFATLNHVLGIDSGAIALTNFSGRPHHLLDDPEPIAVLVG